MKTTHMLLSVHRGEMTLVSNLILNRKIKNVLSKRHQNIDLAAQYLLDSLLFLTWV